MNRLAQLVALSILMVASTLAFADRDHDRGRYHGHSNDHRSQQYGRSDKGSYNYKRGNYYGNRHADKRHANRRYDRHHKRYQNRRHAYHDRNRYRHRHNGRYCYLRHAPAYAGHYGAQIVLPAPPVLVYPPRPRLYIGGTIVF